MNVRRHRPLTLQGLRAFEAVARLLNFRQAGEEMHLTQSAVSRQIRALEDELGAKLFARTPRGVQLLSAGEVFLAHARRILDEVDRAAAAVRKG